MCTISLKLLEYTVQKIPGTEIRMHSGYIKLDDLKSIDFPSINVREGHKTPIEKSICATLLSKVEENPLAIFNQGMSITATAISKKTSNGIEIKFLKGDGIVNGGSTYNTIKKIDSDRIDKNHTLRLEFYTGLTKEQKKFLAINLNSSLPVQKRSIQNLLGTYDLLKKMLEPLPYKNKINFREGDEGYHLKGPKVEEIIQLLCIFNPRVTRLACDESDLNSKKPEPHVFYVGHQATMKKWCCYSKYFEGKFTSEFIDSILKLGNHIVKKINDYKGGNTHVLRPKKSRLFFLDDSTMVKSVPKGYLLPVMSAATKYIKEKNGVYAWTIPYEKLLKLYDKKLPLMLSNIPKDEDVTADSFAKCANNWLALRVL